jgi:hypothetical protein
LVAKHRDFIEKFGDNQGEDLYKDWVENNTYISRRTHKRYGTKELLRPSDKYLNSEFDKIMAPPKTDADRSRQEYYTMVLQLKQQLDSYLPERYRNPFMMPQIRKDFVERIKAIRSKKDLPQLMETFREQFILTEDETEIGRRSSVATDDTGKPANFLPIYYTNRLKNNNDLSLDITAGMSNYAYMAENYKYMNRVIDFLELGKDILEERKIAETDYKGNPIKEFYKKAEDLVNRFIKKESRGSYMYQRLQDYYDMVIYGKLRVSGKPLWKGSNIDQEKFIDFFGRYVAINNLALNIYAGLQNPVYGNAMIRMEGMAKEFVSNKDLLWATARYSTELPKTLAQVGKHYQTGKMQGWFEYFDTLQEQRTNTMSLDTNRKTVFGKMFNFGSLFMINHAGEHLMQGRLSIALSNNTRITDQGVMDLRTYLRRDKKYMELDNKRREILAKSKSRAKVAEIGAATGRELVRQADEVKTQQDARRKELSKTFYDQTAFWDAFEMVGNKLQLKKEFKNKVSEDDITKFTLKQHFLNKRLHGIYNEIDRNAIQKYAIGRLAIMFRKFMKPGFNRRFETLAYNEEAEAFTEGIYTTSWKFLGQLRRDIWKGTYLAKAHWGSLEDYQKANFIRASTEVTYMLAAWILGGILSNLGEGDDDDWTLNMLAYQVNRLYTELRFYSSIREALKIVKSPAAAINQWQKMANLIDTATSIKGWTEELESGKYKGMTRVARQAIEVAPLAKTVSDYLHPADKLMYFTGQNY